MAMNDSEARVALLAIYDHAMTELTVQGWEALVKESGVTDAMAAMKPYKNRNAYILLCMVKKRLHLKGGGIDTLIVPMSLAHAGIGGSENVYQEIKERGAVCYTTNCPYSRALPEFCVVASHYMTDLICDAMNPEYEGIWTHHLSSGDPYCRVIYRKKEGTYTDIEDLGKTVVTIPKIAISKEDERELKDYVLVNLLDAVIEAFVDLHGSKRTVDVLAPLAEKIGMESGTSLAKANLGMKNDAATIGHLMDLFGQAMMQQGTMQAISKDELRKEVTGCPLMVHPYEMCKTLEAVMQGIVRSLNPDMVFSYDSMMTMGDKVCRWHIIPRGATRTKAQEDNVEAVDPLAILKLRLARGEINKVEFEEIKALISS